MQHNITTIVTPSQIFVADQIVQKYYTAPILNCIKSKVKGLKNVSSKHFTIEHWVSVLDSIFVNNTSVRREGSQIQAIDATIGLSGFNIISKYMITDYGQQDADKIHQLVLRYTDIDIQKAVNIAVGNKVYNVQYISAILEREQALSNMRKEEMAKLRERVNNSNHILNRQKVEHSVLDMATNQYNWEQAKQNAELERMLEEKFGNGR
jgi:hypothetical protein